MLDEDLPADVGEQHALAVALDVRRGASGSLLDRRETSGPSASAALRIATTPTRYVARTTCRRPRRSAADRAALLARTMAAAARMSAEQRVERARRGPCRRPLRRRPRLRRRRLARRAGAASTSKAIRASHPRARRSRGSRRTRACAARRASRRESPTPRRTAARRRSAEDGPGGEGDRGRNKVTSRRADAARHGRARAACTRATSPLSTGGSPSGRPSKRSAPQTTPTRSAERGARGQPVHAARAASRRRSSERAPVTTTASTREIGEVDRAARRTMRTAGSGGAGRGTGAPPRRREAQRRIAHAETRAGSPRPATILGRLDALAPPQASRDDGFRDLRLRGSRLRCHDRRGP